MTADEIIAAAEQIPPVSVDRVSWPQVGSYGSPSLRKLADLEANDMQGRRWASLYYFPDSYSDKAEPWFGPVVEDTEVVIALDLDMGQPTRFLKRFCTIRRAN